MGGFEPTAQAQWSLPPPPGSWDQGQAGPGGHHPHGPPPELGERYRDRGRERRDYDMDRKKKGKSKGAKLGAIEETIEVDKNKENGELEKFSSPLYQEYMTKLMTNRGCQDEVPSRRFSVKNKIDEIESKSGESSKNGSPANIRASLRQAAPGVEKSEKVESGSETTTSEENK